MITRRRLLAASAAATLGPALGAVPAARPSWAQAGGADWPTRYVRLIVPFPPGGGTDAVGRFLANKLSEIWGQQVVIENRGGAGSNIGTEAAARAEPDGYTMLFSSLPHAINRFIYPSLPYDPVADFAPITMICSFPNVLVVPNSSPAKSVAELIALSKEKKGLTFGSSGIGSSPHLAGELFKHMAGIEATHVPYRGAGPALNDLVPGRIDMMFNTMGALLPHIRSGQIRGLAVSSAERVPAAPELPTVAESGVPGYDVEAWYAMFAPVKTPPEIVRKMNADAVAALHDPVVKRQIEGLGLQIVASSQAELASTLKSEMEKWGPVIKEANIRAPER